MHGNKNVKFVNTYLPSIPAYKIMNKYYYYFTVYFLQIALFVNSKLGVSWLSRIKSIESTHRTNK
jgi:hypothetical protein